MAPSGSGVTCAAVAAAVAMVAAVALALAPGEVAEVTTMFGRASVACCRFALEGEGVKFVSGVEGVWIAGMGAVDSEF